MQKRISSSMVNALKGKDSVLREPVAGGGSLVARRLTNSTSWRYYYRHNGRTRKFTFGAFSQAGDSTGSPQSTEFTLKGARIRANRLATLYLEVGDLIEHFAEQKELAQANRSAARAQREEAQQQAKDYSLKRLCEAYWLHLESEGKSSRKAVRNSLNRWVINRHPALAATKASEVSTSDVLEVLRVIVDAGHTTTTNRVRSYLSAAYTFGIGSSTNPLASSRAGGFKLAHNPVAATDRVSHFERADEHVLSEVELAELMCRLAKNASPSANIAALSIRLGGQRIQQLLAVTPNEVDASTITLNDPKGRRNQPRKHVLPIVEPLHALIDDALEKRHPTRKGLYCGLTLDTVSKHIRALSKEMVKDKMAAPFTWRDIRRTCETQLSKMGISKDLRAQLLSHGLSGVQDRHYDKHDYLEEKRSVLLAWNARINLLMDGSKLASNVVSLERTVTS